MSKGPSGWGLRASGKRPRRQGPRHGAGRGDWIHKIGEGEGGGGCKPLGQEHHHVLGHWIHKVWEGDGCQPLGQEAHHIA